MAARKGGLGRGLGSLFGDIDLEPVSVIEGKPQPEKADAGEKPAVSKASGAKAGAQKSTASAGRRPAAKAEEPAESVIYVNITDIKPNSKQPRKVFNEEALQELSESIRAYGIIQPIVLRPAKKGYELVAGERRWRAARLAGLKKIPAVVRELSEQQNAFFALIENMQREDLNMIEEAEGIDLLMKEYGLTQEQVALSVGKSRPYVANALRLLKLPEGVQQMVSDGKLTAGHARAIAGLKGEELQTEAAEKAVREGWSVRQIENYTGSVKPAAAKKSRARKKKDQAVIDVEENLSRKLGTKVALNGTEKSGKIEIAYYSRAELDRILEMFE